MPRYQVIYKRAYHEGFLIDADDEAAANAMQGNVVADDRTDSWCDDTYSIDEVAADEQDIRMP